jgi:Flp pilus assembly protein CpaB
VTSERRRELTRQWTRRRVLARRTLLARRRPLAAVCAGVAVLAMLRVLAPEPTATVPVLVAAHDLPAGSVVAADDVVPAAYSPDLVPSHLADDPVGRVLAAPLRRGEPVTDVRLVGPSLTDGYDGLVAVPVRLPDAGSVALLRVGDHIDLVATDPESSAARTVAPGVPVMALPRSDEGADGAGITGRLVVVGASPGVAEDIAAAAVGDFLSFAFAR